MTDDPFPLEKSRTCNTLEPFPQDMRQLRQSLPNSHDNCDTNYDNQNDQRLLPTTVATAIAADYGGG